MGLVISPTKRSSWRTLLSIGVFERGIGFYAKGFHLGTEPGAHEREKGVVGEALETLSGFPEGEGHVARGTAIAAHVVFAFVVDQDRKGDIRRQVLNQRVLDGEVESGGVLGDELVVFAQVFDGHEMGSNRLSRVQTSNAIRTNNKIRTGRGVDA